MFRRLRRKERRGRVQSTESYVVALMTKCVQSTAVQHIPAKLAAVGEWSAQRRAAANERRAMPGIMKEMRSRETRAWAFRRRGGAGPPEKVMARGDGIFRPGDLRIDDVLGSGWVPCKVRLYDCSYCFR
jgi:hypothetical protein